MRILLINWTKLSDGAAHGGGVSGYVQQLALELSVRGHQVCYLSSGVTYTPGLSPCLIRRHDDFRGVRTFEVVNSPVVAPGPCQARDPLAEVRAPDLDAEFTRFIRLLEPDVVHFHNIEGFAASTIGAARAEPRTRVLYSLHNYHTVCPQVYLMQKGRTPCQNYEQGAACVGCFDVCDPEAEKRHRSGLYGAQFPTAPPPPSRPGLGERIVRLFVAPPPPPPAPPIPMPGRGVEQLADLMSGRAAAAVVARTPEPTVDLNPENPEWTPLANDVRPGPEGEGEPNAYAARRRAMIDALSGCDRVLAVSSFVRAKFEAMGVRREVLDTMQIGSRMTEIAAGYAEVLKAPPPFDGRRAIRLAFVGYHNYYKGLHMLADALELLPTDVLGRFDLYVNAKAVEPFEWRLRRLQPRLARLTVQHGYEYDRLPSLVSGCDLGLVPSVWWDNGPQTVMEYFACGMPVLGAALGGIPDLVRDGVNGLLHRGNDRRDLAKKLTEIADDPSVLLRLRAGVKPPLSMREHAATMEGLYARLLASNS